MAMLVSALGLQPQPHACRPTQLHRACTRMDEAALIDDQPLTAPARVKRVTLLPPSVHALSVHTHNTRVLLQPGVCALRAWAHAYAAACSQALTFWGQVVPILGAYKAVELSLEYGERLPAGLAESLNLPVTEEAAEAKYEELHDWGSVRLESTIQELKGFYVKTGQATLTLALTLALALALTLALTLTLTRCCHSPPSRCTLALALTLSLALALTHTQVISTRVDLFPEQYTSRLASLQDDLDPMPASQVAGE